MANTTKLLNKIYAPRPSITLQEARAIRKLKTDQSTIILTTDKGVAMVVMDRQDYINKAQGLLDDKDTYRPISKDPTAKVKKTSLYTYLKTANFRDRSTNLHTIDFTLLVQSQPNFMGYQKSIN